MSTSSGKITGLNNYRNMMQYDYNSSTCPCNAFLNSEKILGWRIILQ